MGAFCDVQALSVAHQLFHEATLSGQLIPESGGVWIFMRLFSVSEKTASTFVLQSWEGDQRCDIGAH